MTILAESVDKQFTSLGAVLLIIGFVCLVTALGIIIEYGFDPPWFLSLLLILSILLIAPSFAILREPHRQLKVMLSEDYPAADLLDKYEIEGRDGEIWMITEKAILEEEEEK